MLQKLENVGYHIKELADNTLQAVWYRLPESVQGSGYVRSFAGLVYSRARRVQPRTPEASYTRFLRNRPQLEVLGEIAARYNRPEPLRLAVLGCSTGAEVYSILHILHGRRSDLKVSTMGLDISEDTIAQAAKGVYGLQDREVAWLSNTEAEALFRRERDELHVHERLRLSEYTKLFGRIAF